MVIHKLIDLSHIITHPYLTKESINYLSDRLKWSSDRIASIPADDAEIINTDFWKEIIGYMLSKEYLPSAAFTLGLSNISEKFRPGKYYVYADIYTEGQAYSCLEFLQFKKTDDGVVLFYRTSDHRDNRIFQILDSELERLLESIAESRYS